MIFQDEISALVACHGVWLSALLRGLTREDADAEDAYQEVWMRVIKRGGLKGIASPRAYLATTARAVVVDLHRRAERLEECRLADDSALETIEDGSPTPQMRFETSATREEILAAIRALPMGPRSVVLMRIEGELTFQQIADLLDVPLGTVLTWMRTATMKLKKILGVEK